LRNIPGPSAFRAPAAAAVVVALSLATPAGAQTAPSSSSEIELPGGVVALARAVGLDGSSTNPARLFVEIAHLAYSVPQGQTENVQALAVIRRYFDLVDELTAANAAGGLTLSSLAGQKVRPRVVDLLGLALSADGTSVIVPEAADTAMAREMADRAGIDVAALAAALNRGGAVTVPLQVDRVRLPLGTAVWARLLPRKDGPRPLHRAILEDRQACLLYAGLAALDPPTLDAIAAAPGLESDLYERAGTFAAFARALHVRDGAIVPPGGPETAALWEAVAGEKLHAVRAFVRALFARDGGRLAYLFDTIAALDPPRQRFALSLGVRNGDDRLDRFRKLASLFASYDESWRIRSTPFSRPAVDPGLLLHVLPVSPEGALPPPDSRAFWTDVFADRPLDSRASAARSDDTAVEAAWLLARVFEPPIATRRDRFERLLFVIRLLSNGASADAAMQAAQGFRRFPALMLTLERMPITDAAVYGEAARAAAALESMDGGDASAAIILFQTSVAVVERARFARTISPETATAVTRALAAVPVSEAGAMARWFEETLLPALSEQGNSAPPSRLDADRVLIRAVAGRPPASPATLDWEGTRYRVDVAESEVKRLERLRRDQKAASVSAILAFARSLARSPADAAGNGEIARTLAALGVDHDPPALSGLRDLMQGAQRAVRDGTLKSGDRARLVRLADHLLAYSLLTFAYATSLGDADADPTTVFDPNLGDRHDLSRRTASTWRLPHEESGVGQPWHLQGSLLALDTGLARFALRRLSTEPPIRAPEVSSNDRRTFAESVAFMNPYDLRDEDLKAIAATLARGRARVAELQAGDGNRLDAISEAAGLGAWDRETLRWTLAHDREAVLGLFSLTELFWLGAPTAPLVARLDAWGVSARPIDGSLRSTFPRAEPWETFSGRPSIGLMAARTAEMTLRVAAALAELDLPAALIRGVVSAATLDLVDEAPLGHHDDRRAVAKYAEAVPLVRIQDYVSFLTASGPLIPVRSARREPAAR
jgi:hypothetical protein